MRADAERAKTVRIAKAEDFALAHQHDREGAFDTPQRGKDTAGTARLREQVEDNLAVDGGLKYRALGFQFFAKLCRIDEVAIVTDGDLAAAGIHHERLSVLDCA